MILLDRLLLPDFVWFILAFGVKRCDDPVSTSGGKEMARARGINSEDTLAVIFERRGEGKGRERKGRERDGNKRKTRLKKDRNREVKEEKDEKKERRQKGDK